MASSIKTGVKLMDLAKMVWRSPAEYLIALKPENPVLFFAPSALQATAQEFINGFAGTVTYAVKANPAESVIKALAAAGIAAFDVASPEEMRLIRRLAPDAVLHYNNPVRARSEIGEAVALGVQSYSVDDAAELAKLVSLVPAQGTEIAVRFALPVAGAAYDFGEKFGATPARAAVLLRAVEKAGFVPSLCFHPGTQCSAAGAWESYIAMAAEIAKAAGVRIARLNVGGGFPSYRIADLPPDLPAIFAAIARATAQAFGAEAPKLLCEPGRGMCGDAFVLATRVKALRERGDVFLNDGVYGALAERPMLNVIDRRLVISSEGVRRSGPLVPRVVFGPTCDSVDRLPGEVMLPADLEEGDCVLFYGMGAYSWVTNTRFNGYGALGFEQVQCL
jgi:ornithine decarboxylase